MIRVQTLVSDNRVQVWRVENIVENQAASSQNRSTRDKRQGKRTTGKELYWGAGRMTGFPTR